ncbi:MAG: hypothetical protein KME12_20120 [Trichocoleus desertorum ATA4-8-CV12]|nr:hypothetical protein [Trichocoleus desertorum ATA4-8-CV12]
MGLEKNSLAIIPSLNLIPRDGCCQSRSLEPIAVLKSSNWSLTLFTTKEGKGTGLGLSISRQIIVEKHGGTLTCTSALGQGTEFAIAIPQR